MVYSMTGYANLDVAIPGGMIRWEIRSVNQRYLELSFKLPSIFSALEYPLRELVKTKVRRGKVDCFLRMDVLEEANVALSLNLELADQLMALQHQISERYQLQHAVSAFEILNWPLVLKTMPKDTTPLQPLLLQSFEIVLQSFMETRGREGEKLKGCISERVYKMRQLIQGIVQRLPEIERLNQLKFEKKLQELKLDLEAERIEPVLSSLMQKLDISEELDRLQLHLAEVERILTEEQLMGRRLDFIMQELNREANTLVAKALEGITIQDGVQLKVYIEEMREQIQNIE